jgi:serine/threonine-protein kinase
LGDSGYGTIPPTVAKAKARAAIEKALALNPNIAEAYAVLGNLQLNHDWDKYGAERSYRRAIEINPGYPTAHHWLGWCLIIQKRFEEAEVEFKRASELDPTSMAIITEQGYPSFFAGDLARAESIFRQAVAMDGSYASARMSLWRTLHHAGRIAETLPQVEATESIVGHNVPVVMMARGRTLALAGRKDEALAVYQKLKNRKNSGEYFSPLYLALLAADLNNSDETFYWLEECFKERNDYLLFLPIAPEFKRFKDDSRFLELSTRVGV